MRKVIFQIENKNSFKNEYFQMIKVLNKPCVSYEKKNYSYFDFINTYLFHHWKYRSTFLDCDSYLKHIGIDLKSHKFHEESFLNFLEFLLNIQLLMESMKSMKNLSFQEDAHSILFHNIPLIIEEMGYSIFSIDDKVYLLPRDVFYENVMELIPDDLGELLASYQLNQNSGIKMKRVILHKIYLKLEDYKGCVPGIYSSIKMIITKMGVIGEVDSKYKSYSPYKLKKYYDYCFEMMCYLIESKKINQYKSELKGE